MGRENPYDRRIRAILGKIEALRGAKLPFGRGTRQPAWLPPLPEEEVAAFEREKGIRLPADYRRFLTAFAGGGKQPFGRLYPLSQPDNKAEYPFPYDWNHVLYFPYMTQEQMDEFYGENTPFVADHGLLTLCHEGDGMKSVLVVNSPDPEVYGTVWYFDLANDCGALPMFDGKTGKPFHFLDWLEYWADRTAALTGDEYFGFAETVRLPEPPEDPEILGRKMGWIP